MNFTFQLLVAVAFLFGIAAARNTLFFVPHDHVDRVIHFESNPGCKEMPDVPAPAGQRVLVEVPQKWEGMFMAKTPDGMIQRVIGEVAFQGWPNGQNTFFDISAVDNHQDRTGIHRMYPANRPNDPRSGCRVMPCRDIYMFWDDHKQTKSTTATEMIVEMGIPPNDDELMP